MIFGFGEPEALQTKVTCDPSTAVWFVGLCRIVGGAGGKSILIINYSIFMKLSANKNHHLWELTCNELVSLIGESQGLFQDTAQKSGFKQSQRL